MRLFDDNKLQQAILDIPGWLSLEEGLTLYKLAGKDTGSGLIVEIGSFQGKSTVFMGLALKEKNQGMIISIDPHMGVTEEHGKPTQPTFAKFKNNIRKYGLGKFIKPMKMSSETANKKWSHEINLLFIDALHEPKFVKKDIDLWLPYIANHGTVVCHDAFTPYKGVYQAVEEKLLGHPKLLKIGLANSLIFCVMGTEASLTDWLILGWNKTVIHTALNIWQNLSLPEKFRNVCTVILKKILVKNII